MEKVFVSEQEAFENLAIAVVGQAVEDYKEAVKNGKEKRIAEVERFFKSKWGSMLTFNNGAYVLNRVKKEMEE
jgi:hypothetical protein